MPTEKKPQPTFGSVRDLMKSSPPDDRAKPYQVRPRSGADRVFVWARNNADAAIAAIRSAGGTITLCRTDIAPDQAVDAILALDESGRRAVLAELQAAAKRAA